MSVSKKLFIIGNGFDLFHQLPTAYCDFRDFFMRPIQQIDWLGADPLSFMNHPIIMIDDIIMSTVRKDYMINSERIAITINKQAPFYNMTCKRLKRKGIPIFDRSFLWSDFEGVLGRMNCSEYLNDQYYGEVSVKNAFSYLKSAFPKWISSIDVSQTIRHPKLEKMFSSGDNLFLTFNYTTTLETVYGISPDKICHIHGKAGEKLTFGHSGLTESDFLKNNVCSNNKTLSKEIFEAFYKNDKMIFNRNLAYFDQINDDTADIYVHGFSFSTGDLRYVAEICRRTKNAHWHFNDYEPKEKITKFKNIIIGFGGRGDFDSYSLPAFMQKRKKISKPSIGQIIKALIRSNLRQLDPLIERCLFGFDPNNTQKFFYKPYWKCIKKVFIISSLLIFGIIIRVFIAICDLLSAVYYVSKTLFRRLLKRKEDVG